GSSTLSLKLHRVDRLARGHEQEIALRPAEGQVRAILRQSESSEQLRPGVVAKHAGIAERAAGTAPGAAGRVDANAVRSELHAVDLHVDEHASIGGLAAVDVESKD